MPVLVYFTRDEICSKTLMKKYVLLLIIGCSTYLTFVGIAQSQPQINLLASSLHSSSSLDQVWELILKARQLAGEDKQNKAVAILTQAFRMAQELEDKQDKKEALVTVITELVDIGAREKAITLIKEINNNAIATETQGLVTQAYLTAGEYEQALQYVRSLPSEAAQSQALVQVAATFSRVGKLAEAEEIAFSLRGNSYHQYQATKAIIQSYSKKQRYQEALALISTLTDENHLYSVVSNLAEDAGRAGYYEIALAASQKLPNLVYRIQVLQSLADAHLAVGQQKQAKAIVNQAVELSKQTEDPPLTNWLEPWLATGQEEKVRAFAAKLNSDAHKAAFNRSLLTHSYLNQGRYRQAFEFAKLIPDDVLLPLPEYTDPKVELFFAIINQALTAKDFTFAKEVALSLTKKEDQISTLQIIARAYNQQGNSEETRQKAEGRGQKGIEFELLLSSVADDNRRQCNCSEEAIKILNLAFNIAKTIEVVQVVPERHLYLEYSNATILISLARDYVDSGQKQRGLEILALAAQSIEEFNQQLLSNANNSTLFYSANRIWSVAEEYIELGEAEQAAVLLKKAWQESLAFPSTPDNRVRDILTIARLEQKIGNFDRVKSIIAQAREINQTVTEKQSGVYAQLQFASLLAEIGEVKAAKATLAETVPVLTELNDISLLRNSLAIYKNIDTQNPQITSLINQVVQEIRKLPSDQEKDQQLESLVATLADEPQLAGQVVQQFQNPEQQTNMLLTLVQKYNSLNNSALSSQNLNQALVTLQKIPSTKAKDLLLTLKVGAFDSSSSYGFFVPAPGWSDEQISKITQEISEPKIKANMLLGFAFNYAKQGKNQASAQALTLTWKAAQKIQQKSDWEDKLWEALQASLEAEEYDLAEQIALGMSGIDYQITALRRVAQKYAIAKQQPQARQILSQAQQLANSLEPGSHKEQVLSAIANQVNSQK